MDDEGIKGLSLTCNEISDQLSKAKGAKAQEWLCVFVSKYKETQPRVENSGDTFQPIIGLIKERLDQYTK